MRTEMVLMGTLLLVKQGTSIGSEAYAQTYVERGVLECSV